MSGFFSRWASQLFPGRRKPKATEARRRRLRALLTVDAASPRWKKISPARFALGAGVTLLLTLILAIPLISNRLSWKVGDLANREIIAPRTVHYDDTESTRRLREDAAAQVERRYDPIVGATLSATEAIRILFDRLETANTSDPAGATVLAESIAADVQRESNRTLPVADILTLIQEPVQTRRQARSVARELVSREISRSITEGTNELHEAQNDVRRSSLLEALPNDRMRGAIASLGAESLTPTRRFNERSTEREEEAARAAVPPQLVRLPAGTVVVRAGEKVTQKHLDALAALGLQRDMPDAASTLTVLALVCFLVALVAYYLRLYHQEVFYDNGRLLLVCVLAVFSVVGLKVGAWLFAISVPGVHAGYLGMMCVASAGMAIALLISPRVATLITAVLSVASGLILNNELRFTLITLGSSLIGIVSVATLRNRTDLLKSALLICGGNAALNAIAGQWAGDAHREIATNVLWGVISGVFALVLFYIAVAALERPFGITTHLRLLELSDPATPLLQQFRLKAPGTYAHSLSMGNLAQAAAEAIGANALLCRVGAYYHDIGKVNRPEFFIENQSGAENAHDNLTPTMSALILAAHVKEGLEIATAISLPPRVRDLIAQHHGTSLMKFFYHRASGGVADPALENQFRYPGPKPQTREAAILMIADSVEAASRTLERPTPARISEFVSRMVEDKRAEGQLDECDLTIRELTIVQEAMAQALTGVFHGRVVYPGQKTIPELPAGLTFTSYLGEGVGEKMETASVHPSLAARRGEELLKRSGFIESPDDGHDEPKTHGINDSNPPRPDSPLPDPGADSGEKTAERRR